jgi:hypothetical protein
MTDFRVVPYKKWPVAETTSWDATQADNAMRKWASSDGSGDAETIDWPKYRQGFTAYDADLPELFGSYKSPHHNVIDGQFVTDRQGVFAARQRLSATKVPAQVRDQMRAHLDKHYKDMGLEPPGEEERMPKSLGRQICHRGVGVILDRQDETGPIDANAELAALFTERVGIPTEGIFVFPLQPSTQSVDSYFTRMSAQSLQNYQRNAVEGVPFMNSHRTGGCALDAELPLGQSFDGQLSGQPADETPVFKMDTVPEPDKVDLFSLGMTLRTMDYMKPGMFPNGRNQPGTDDVIDMIESKTLRQVSIGFGHQAPDRLLYICGLCGNSVGQKSDDEELQCSHVPGFRSKDTGHVAFAWVHNGRMFEHSGVWAGATPGAVVGHAPAPLVMQARSVAANGLLTAEEVDLAEEMYGTKVGPGEQFQVADYHDEEVRTVGEEKERDEGMIENEEPCGKTEIRTVKDHLTGIEEALHRNTEATHELLRALVERTGETSTVMLEVEGIEDMAGRLEAIADKLADVEAQQESKVLDARTLLVERIVKANIRAYGQMLVDVKQLEKMLTALDDEELLEKAERDEALNPFKPGRQVTEVLGGGTKDDTHEVDIASYHVG